MARGSPTSLAALACSALLMGCIHDGVFRNEPKELTTAPQKPLKKLDSIRTVSAKAQDLLPTPTELAAEPEEDVLFSTVQSADLPKRKISLAECVALALENGRTGDSYDGPGQRKKSSVTGIRLQNALSNNSDAIRVFAYDPAIARTESEEALSRFDAWHETAMFWDRYDQKTRFLFTPTAFEQFTARNKLDSVIFRSGVYRKLESGGFAGVDFINNHEDNFLGPDARILNPAERPSINFYFEQPLLQGAGYYINQLRDAHPGSIRQNFPDYTRPPGILLTRISQQQTQLEFERQVHDLVYRVEEAYWQLYAAYWDLYGSDNGMKQSHAAWQIAKARFDAGGIGIEDLAMIEEQYHFFRNQRLQALGRGQPGRAGVLEAERLLRFVVGLPAEDGTRLIPCDEPKFLEYEPDLQKSLREARLFRPEVRQVDQAIQAAQYGIARAEDRLQPDLRFVSKYDMNGLGTNVPQGITNLFTNPHHEWELGLRLQVPIGFRAGNAEMARAKMLLMQSLVFYDDQRQKLIFSLQRSYRDLTQLREQYKIRQSQRVAAEKQLVARYEKFKAGGDPKMPGSFIDMMLRAQRNWVDAVREEHAALSEYRTAITDYERQKGTILHFANVTLAEGAMPAEIAPNASRHIRDWHHKRSHAEMHAPIVSDDVPLPAQHTLPDFSLSKSDNASFDASAKEEPLGDVRLGSPLRATRPSAMPRVQKVTEFPAPPAPLPPATPTSLPPVVSQDPPLGRLDPPRLGLPRADSR